MSYTGWKIRNIKTGEFLNIGGRFHPFDAVGHLYHSLGFAKGAMKRKKIDLARHAPEGIEFVEYILLERGVVKSE